MFCVFCLTNTGFVQCYTLGCHKVCCTLVLYIASFSNFCFACFASQTSGLCSAFPLAPVKSVRRFKFCYALVSVSCFTNTGFVQCYRLGSRKVCCTLLFNFALFSNFCFACFASQTSSLCSAIPSAPVKFVAHLCLIFLYSVIFVLCALPHKHRVCAVLFPSAPLKFTPFWFSLFYSVCFCCACFAQQAPVCAVIFPRLPSNLHALLFALYYLDLSLCSAFFPSLI